MGQSSICWNSKKKKKKKKKKKTTETTSKMKADNISTSECVKKVLWLRSIVIELFFINFVNCNHLFNYI